MTSSFSQNKKVISASFHCAKELYKILLDDLKIPPQWIPNKKFEPNIADPLARTRAGKNIQNGTGWVIYG